MSLFFFDGFDFSDGNDYGPGGRLWDVGSSASGGQTGRWENFAVAPGGSGNLFINQFDGMHKTFTSNRAGVIVGVAARFDAFVGGFANITNPFMFFGDKQGPTETIQCSLWLDPTTFTITVRTGRGDLITDTTLVDTGFTPPLTLWFYMEVGVTIGNPGHIQIRIDGNIIVDIGGVQTEQSGNNTWNVFHMSAMGAFGPGWFVDDLYLVDPNDAIGNTNYLGEIRVQTKTADADGFQNDFLRSQGLTNAPNVALLPTIYLDNGKYNYNGNVNAIDLYQITPFAITGTIFGVQENMSVRKDDTGSRQVAPLLRTASTEFLGPSFVCFSSYTYMGVIWEYNPEDNAPWLLSDLNGSEFGLKITG